MTNQFTIFAPQLAEQYLSNFIKNISCSDASQLFIIGHSLELYIKYIIYQKNGNAPFGHDLNYLLKKASKLDDRFLPILDDVSLFPKNSILYHVYSNLQDIKYINSFPNEKINSDSFLLFYGHFEIIFKHLKILFEIGDININNSLIIRDLIDEENIFAYSLYPPLSTFEDKIRELLKECLISGYTSKYKVLSSVPSITSATLNNNGTFTQPSNSSFSFEENLKNSMNENGDKIFKF